MSTIVRQCEKTEACVAHTSGKSLANEMAATIPSRKKFFDKKAFVSSQTDEADGVDGVAGVYGVDGLVASPPRTTIPSAVSLSELSPLNKGRDAE